MGSFKVKFCEHAQIIYSKKLLTYYGVQKSQGR